ncbi:MAG: hypothetical protein V2L15_03125, partial [Desulfobacteraceae bacterium]|nr:hypothetical protein [Desulfobacteraceae bacterium]
MGFMVEAPLVAVKKHFPKVDRIEKNTAKGLRHPEKLATRTPSRLKTSAMPLCAEIPRFARDDNAGLLGCN